jgi:hypothetical protein
MNRIAVQRYFCTGSYLTAQHPVNGEVMLPATVSKGKFRDGLIPPLAMQYHTVKKEP